MLKIGAFSKLTQVSARMLRHYDQAGLLKPEKVDPCTGYRLYSVEQIPRLKRILFLRDVGFGIAEMEATLKAWERGQIVPLLEEKRRQTAAQMTALASRVDKIDRAFADLAGQTMEVHCDVTIKAVPGCLALSLRRRLPDYWSEGALWKEFAAMANGNGLDLTGQTFSIYHDEDYREKDVDVELCLPVPPGTPQVEGLTLRDVAAVEHMASALVAGPFENISRAYLAFAGWLSGQPEYEMEGSSRQIVHRGPWNEPDPQNWLTEMQIPLWRRL